MWMQPAQAGDPDQPAAGPAGSRSADPGTGSAAGLTELSASGGSALDWGACRHCASGRRAATTVITVNDWLLEMCWVCARAACDPISGPPEN